VNWAMKFRIPWNAENFFSRGVISSFSKRTLVLVLNLRGLIGRRPSLFFTVSCLLVSFRALFHAVVCECYDTSHWTVLSVNAIPNTLHALCSRGCTPLQLSVPDRRKEVTLPVPPVLFCVFYMYIEVNQKRN